MLLDLKPPSDINPIRARARKKRCYELTVKFVLNNPTWDVVHAIIFPPEFLIPIPIPHAFAIREDIIYDSVDNKFYKTTEYINYLSAQLMRYYSSMDVARCLTSTKRYGPR